MKPIICSFYTPEYAHLAQKMIESVKSFGFTTDVLAIEKINNDWLDTIYWRPSFIKKMLEKHHQDVVWLDCDAVMKSYPILFDNFKGDFGVHIHDFRWRKNEYLGGTMYFSYNPRTLNFLNHWIELNQTEQRQALSQWMIPKAIEKTSLLFVDILPEEYCNIFDHINCKNPVISHYQASREFRNG